MKAGVERLKDVISDVRHSGRERLAEVVRALCNLVAIHARYVTSSQATTESLVVHIIDVNDNPPVFTEPEGYHFTVDEGKAGLIVGMVTVNKHRISGLENQSLESPSGGRRWGEGM